MARRKRIFIAISLLLSLVSAAEFMRRFSTPSAPRATGRLPMQAYVFQRDWNEPVTRAAKNHGQAFSELAILAGEISFRDAGPETVLVDVDYEALSPARVPVGLVLRLGPISSADKTAFEPDSIDSIHIAQAVHQIIDKARNARIEPVELQIDFDCPESRLAGFGNWVRLVQSIAVGSNSHPAIPVTITALPAWIKDSSFDDLAHLAGSFILQVHALHKPSGPDAPMVLCDPVEAKADVEKASRTGVPFRVALPTYTYVAGFDNSGKLLGLSAEGAPPRWPNLSTQTLLSADPQSLSQLIRDWTRDRPANLTGVIWYRLPVETDRLNWRWECLQAVMAGQTPEGRVRISLRSVEPMLNDVELINDGNADAVFDSDARISWPATAKFVAADSLDGFEFHLIDPSTISFQPTASLKIQRLAPGEHRTIGWVRLDSSVAMNGSLQQPAIHHFDSLAASEK